MRWIQESNWYPRIQRWGGYRRVIYIQGYRDVGGYRRVIGIQGYRDVGGYRRVIDIQGYRDEVDTGE